MNEEKLKVAFSKIKEEMENLSIEMVELKNKKVIETPVKDDRGIESLEQKVVLLEHSLNSLERSTIETLTRIREEFNTKLEEEVSSIRLELMDVIMRKEGSQASQFEQELRNTY